MKKYLFFLLFSIGLTQENVADSIRNISIVSTTNVYSEFYDCGCPKNPRGGIARKAFFLAKFIKETIFRLMLEIRCLIAI